MGHQRFEWNQVNTPYLLAYRKNFHIINLRWTVLLLRLTTKFMISATSNYNRILFVLGNKYELIFDHFSMIMKTIKGYLTYNKKGGGSFINPKPYYMAR